MHVPVTFQVSAIETNKIVRIKMVRYMNVSLAIYYIWG